MKRLLASWIVTVLVVGCASNTTVPQKQATEPAAVRAPTAVPVENPAPSAAQMCTNATVSHAVTATSVSVDGGVDT
jgi:hypothetical protein